MLLRSPEEVNMIPRRDLFYFFLLLCFELGR